MSYRRLLPSFSPISSNRGYTPFLRLSNPLSSFSTSSAAEAERAVAAAAGGKTGLFKRRVVPIVLLSLTGGVALSALNDLAIFHGCSSKAIEKATRNQKVVEALGEPIVRGAWYDASLAVGHRRQSVSCTFPVSGPQGTGVFQLKAVRAGEDTWFSFLRHHDWDILVMEALLYVPTNDEKNRTFRVSVADSGVSATPSAPTSAVVESKDCRSAEPEISEEK